MKTYLTGNLNGYNKDEALKSLCSTMDELFDTGVKKIYTPIDFVEMKQKEQLRKRLSTVRECDVIVFQSGWKEDVNACWEWMEASKMHKVIRIDNASDIEDIRKMASGELPVCRECSIQVS
ncbi:MAG: hypothetical protein PF489_12805 [Salinivirgaceae bacterium]|jgi:hypothetical protein|nr:hypothetical protein [Salinivirgaceae bacterium]